MVFVEAGFLLVVVRQRDRGENKQKKGGPRRNTAKSVPGHKTTETRKGEGCGKEEEEENEETKVSVQDRNGRK